MRPVGMIDGKGVFIARLRNHDQFVGKPAGNDLLALSGDQGSIFQSPLTTLSITGVSVVKPQWLSLS